MELEDRPHESKELKKDFETLSRNAYLDVLVPRSSDVDVKRLLDDGPEGLFQLPTRRNVFLGMSSTSV